MQAWETFVESQISELGSETVNKWLKNLKILRFDACNLYLEAKDAFQAMWFEEHIRQKVQTRLINNNKRRIKIHLSIENVPVKVKTKTGKIAPPAEISRPSFVLEFDEIDPYCNFANFVISDANHFTSRVFSQIAGIAKDEKSQQLPTLNPLYVHGIKGSGKTHLLMATAQALKAQGCHVLYTKAQRFTDHVVSAIRAGEMSIFRQTYRNIDVLIVDDIQVFSRKGATQEEFFHTFNTLQVAGKQIILSANCAPGELKFIEPRLVSRFEWGIVLSLEAPLREEMSQIICARALALQFTLAPKILDFLLNTFTTATSIIRALEALILRLHMNQGTAKSPIPHLTPLLVENMLADLIAEELEAALTSDKIVLGVAEFFGLRPEDILGKTQTRDHVLPRQISMHLCRHQLKMPYVKIGDLFQKDHSTVMSSVKLIEKGIDADDKEIASVYRAILKQIKTEGRSLKGDE